MQLIKTLVIVWFCLIILCNSQLLFGTTYPSHIVFVGGIIYLVVKFNNYLKTRI